MRRVLAGLALILLAAHPAASQGERDLGGVTVLEVAHHAILAPQIVDYEGTKVLSVWRGHQMETVTISEVRKRPGKARFEFLSPEGVAGRLVVDDGVRTWHYEPRLHTVFQGPTLSAPVQQVEAGAAHRLLERYDVRLLGVEEVIARPTAVLSLRPRTGGGERRLWIDRTTGVALRVEERDPDDGLILASYFTRISFGLNIPAALFRPPLPAGVRVVGQEWPGGPLQPAAALERRLRFALPAPGSLPGGFVLAGGQPVRGGRWVAARLHYTDGARVVSVFVAPAARMGPPGRGEPVPALGGQARTLVVGALRLVLWETGGQRVTLVGPLPLPEMVRLAAAFSASRP